MRNKNFSRQDFLEALLTLSKREPYNEIQISEICNEAGYHRSTFYRCFKTKEDVLLYGFTLFVDECGDALQQQYSIEKYIENATKIFSMIRKNSALFLLLHEIRFDYELLQVLTSVFPLNVKDKQNEKYYISFQANGHIAVVMKWLLDGMKESDEYMGNLCANIVKDSLVC